MHDAGPVGLMNGSAWASAWRRQLSMKNRQQTDDGERQSQSPHTGNPEEGGVVGGSDGHRTSSQHGSPA